ncbi:choline transporter [Plantibacter sp. Leaf171]|uniref:BCCT family transporter n=1 Tax=unclassified Plantibacter TaxID=2624265 RepID=UPI0006F9A282|nr:choline transporter [Plantibacter sp. Leaf1]KQQ50244.1 choline transporter [Plantibacter sp. Leaf314]KQR57658.1 choline transporter [Plantibacter sp. Leaf171]
MSTKTIPTSDAATAKAPTKVIPWVLGPALVVILGVALFSILLPEQAESVFGSIQSGIIGGLGWYYVLLVAAFVIVAIVFAVSKFGDIKLGKDDDEPEFSLMSWFSMLFAAGMGIGLVFYGVGEPLTHFLEPRPGVVGSQQSLAQQAMSQTYLHWGLHAWSIYAVVGVALAYAVHRKGRPMSIRWAIEPLLGKRVQGGWGNAIDTIAVIGTVFGVATSLGLGVLQISAGLGYTGIAEPNILTQVILILVITGVTIFSLVSGVHKGMKWLSNTNLILAGLLLFFVLFAGPTLFLLREWVQSMGAYLQNVVGLTFNVSAYQGAAGEAWQSSWTTFYWGWWMSWAPFVGVFIARISKGRTVRQFVLGVLLVPTLVTFLWFAVLGGTAIMQSLEGRDFSGSDGPVDLNTALFNMLAGLPGGSIATVGALLLILLFFVTSADSGSLVMGMLTTGGTEPRNRVRIAWALVTSLLAISLLIAGGLASMQTAAIITALPFSIVIILMCVSSFKAFGIEVRREQRAKRRLFAAELTESVSADLSGQVSDQVTEQVTEHLGTMTAQLDLRQLASPDAPPATDASTSAESDRPDSGR